MSEEVWNKFQRRVLLARNYGKPFEIAQNPWRGREDDVLPAPQNPILEGILPPLLYVQMCSLFDEFLGDAAARLGVTVGGRDHLYDRIEALAGYLTNVSTLHAIRKRRSDFAHVDNAECTWEELDDAIDQVHAALAELSVVTGRPDYEIAMSWDLESFDPPKAFNRGPGWRADVSTVRSYTVGVKLDDSWVEQYEWQVADTVTWPD
ncbi:MAG: hypothetical protein JJLCMIEE_03585 [Acidimicrobiales bacterium]|nr:MAG: hypothetical protein EDR02_16110 [Actinomycetota bacterium]MBV6510438.1 hypothetical protein [Acidimicrobiales bacterium]RIK03757.1 MAG: hypothetical protein DCC48_15630 [Acidobacteriota bacterium]